MGMNDKHNYDPTKWVDNSEPDIDAEHLNKIESALQEYGVSIDELAAAGGTAAKVKTTDTYGLVVSALGESTAQALIDAIANKVMNELINKNKIVNNLLATDASTVLAGTQGTALDKRLVAAEKAVTQLNSELWPRNSGTIIQNGTDMHTIKTPGYYCCTSNATAVTLKNCPFTEAFTLVVYWSTGYPGAYLSQEYTHYIGNRRVIQNYNADTATWKKYEFQITMK